MRPSEYDPAGYPMTMKLIEEGRRHLLMPGPIAFEGKVYLLEIDVQGALQLRELGVEAAYVFVAAPDDTELRRRLVDRGTDEPDVVERRLKKALDEMEERHRYDHVVINDDLERAVGEVRHIVGLDTPQEV